MTFINHSNLNFSYYIVKTFFQDRSKFVVLHKIIQFKYFRLASQCLGVDLVLYSIMNIWLYGLREWILK